MYELQALLAFKGGLSNHTTLSSWTMENSHNLCVSWEGVICNNVTGQVIMLDLRDLNLSVWKYPISLMHLPLLKVLSLSGLNGTLPIPKDIWNLTHLEELHPEDCSLTGSLPPQLGQMGALITLDFRYNIFTDSIPMILGHLSNLNTSLDLSSNQLTGVIPPSLGELVGLCILNLSHTHSSGNIPQTLGKMELTFGMKSLNLSNNMLSGALPPSFFSLSCSLQHLDVSKNWLTGSSLGDLSNLLYMDLSQNALQGIILASLSHLNIGLFNVSHNNLSGSIPQTGKLTTFPASSYARNPYLCGLPLITVQCSPNPTE
ncbi:hypothetical protein SELMODRAFT_128654 [Selaginella moellendorffii]|uniref:Leucine-rich repeat-containing N-terminal plant-type domain-containing protein n=1 Tax=Selaginella moellendorffii TaxID=88036 RepID=D8SZT0_SELML|nr:hypothetical protein SELMODRAFT_128654 [Selaginella moellendorffii]